MTESLRAVQDAISFVSTTGGIPDDVKKNLVDILRPALSPLASDPWIYRMVVGFLGFTVLATVIGGLLIKAYSGGEITQGIIALGSAAVGALAGLLAPSPVGQSQKS
jgi:hypothetical protein